MMLLVFPHDSIITFILYIDASLSLSNLELVQVDRQVPSPQSISMLKKN